MIDTSSSSTNGIVYTARLHWVIFVWPTILFCGMLLFGLYVESQHVQTLSFFIALIAMLWAGLVWLTYHFSFLTIKKKQVILCSGVLVRQTIDIPLNKIESVDIRQSVMGSLLHYGSLVITGTGGTRQYINYLDKPLTCRRHIEQLLHD